MSKGIDLDIRTKFIILFLVTSCVSLSSSIKVELIAMAGMGLLQFLSGRKVFSVKIVSLYIILVLIQYLIFPVVPKAVVMVLSIFVVNIRVMFPTAMGFVWIYKTTRVNQLIATMGKMKIPKSATVSIAVTLRFFPTIFEEWSFIRDAMRIRRIAVTGMNPIKRLGKKIECYIIPLLISATKTADELSAAAITRGIDNPVQGTCRGYRKMNAIDFLIISLVLIFTVSVLVL